MRTKNDLFRSLKAITNLQKANESVWVKPESYQQIAVIATTAKPHGLEPHGGLIDMDRISKVNV